ncbi:hypothetical protein [Actomonas aquatica]|uniref:Uncharacterized protein n=1 Tax=Actomonas aquatica TaxID=2866162 RepID=A0ABZ1CDP6_9BACT|nr:hypothetical protein [Opitutus sp. WL0086]WRQ89537.1 hypothetical protein K1X11_008960 [Opitutus sp. WL0086]
MLLTALIGRPLDLSAESPTPQVGSQWDETSESYIERHEITLTAPAAAIRAYREAFTQREWFIGAESRSAFMGLLFGLELRPAIRDQILDPSHWEALPDGGFRVQPPLELQRAFTSAERRELYQLLATWTPNKVERWPLVANHETDFTRWQAAGVPSALIARFRELSYPFAGGWACSDYAVIAAEFPNPAILQRWLREVSSVRTIVPHLRLSTTRSVSRALAYWTADGNNPFARPLLEALLESETENDIDLASILPAAARALSFELSPDDVRHDFTRQSLIVSTSLAVPPQHLDQLDRFFNWFERNFRTVSDPPRFGDIWSFESAPDTAPGIPYACAHVVRDLVFARDPAGLGVWRFMTLAELTRRNPHFTDGHFVHLRYSPPVPKS